MTVNELIEKLSALDVDQREMKVCVHDGMDPSDVDEAHFVETGAHDLEGKPCVQIRC